MPLYSAFSDAHTLSNLFDWQISLPAQAESLSLAFWKQCDEFVYIFFVEVSINIGFYVRAVFKTDFFGNFLDAFFPVCSPEPVENNISSSDEKEAVEIFPRVNEVPFIPNPEKNFLDNILPFEVIVYKQSGELVHLIPESPVHSFKCLEVPVFQ